MKEWILFKAVVIGLIGCVIVETFEPSSFDLLMFFLIFNMSLDQMGGDR